MPRHILCPATCHAPLLHVYRMLIWSHFHQCRMCLFFVCECCCIVTLSDHAFADYEVLLQLDQPGDQGPQQSTASEAQLASVPSFTYQVDQVCLHACRYNHLKQPELTSLLQWCAGKMLQQCMIMQRMVKLQTCAICSQANVETCSYLNLLAHQWHSWGCHDQLASFQQTHQLPHFTKRFCYYAESTVRWQWRWQQDCVQRLSGFIHSWGPTEHFAMQS
jgi:hypothetical protein